MSNSNPLFISSPGLTDQDRSVLVRAISDLTHDGKVFNLLTKNIRKAHLLIVDDETVNGRTCLQNSSNGQVKLVISCQPRMGKNIIGIKKPLNLTYLKEILSRIFIKLQPQLKTRKTKTTVKKTKSDSLLNDPSIKNTLFYTLFDIKESGGVLHIVCPGFPDIYANGSNRSIATSANLAQIREIAKLPHEQLWIEKLIEQDFHSRSDGLNIFPLFNILWITAIESSKGRLLPGHNIDNPVKLKAWPNFTRTDFCADHLKLSAVLARQAISLNALVQATQIELDKVIDLYNAAYAVDLIESAIDSVSEQVPQRNVSDQMKNLFSKITRRLSFAS